MSDKNFYCGVVESRDDPLKLGRVRVRIAGCHTHDTKVLPTKDLPWASVLDANRGIPKEGTVVSIEFWDYPENQMPVVTGVIPSIPQRESIFIDKADSTAQIKDTLTPNGRSVPTNQGESTGGVDENVVIDNNNPSPEMKSALEKSYRESSSNQTAIVNILTNDSTSNIGGIGAVAQVEQSLGKTIKSKKDELYSNISKYGDIAKAQYVTVSALSEKIGSSIPNDLLSGKLEPSKMMSGINTMLQNITSGVGASSAAKLINNLSGISGIGTGTVGNVLSNKVVSAVNSALGSSGISTLSKVSDVTNALSNPSNFVNSASNALSNKLLGKVTSSIGSNNITYISQASGLLSSLSGGTNTVTNAASNLVNSSVLSSVGSEVVGSLSQGMTALSSLGIGTMNDFAGMFGTGLKSLTSELSNITSSVTSTISDGLSKISGLSDSANLKSLIDGVALPEGITEIVENLGSIEKALVEKADEMVGKGYTSALALSKDVGGVKTAEEAVKKAEEEIEDLKNTNVSLTKENFKNVEEGKTPPVSGSNGGSNYGGANATNTIPEKQNTEKFAYGADREVENSWLDDKGDYDIIVSTAKENGITTTESLSTYLTIIYCLNDGFTQKLERTSFNKDELKRFFPISFAKADDDTIKEYTFAGSSNKKTEKEFLSFVYNSANDGITYGNDSPSDGSLYYGYGYIKIVGRSAYTRYAKILDNKDLLTKGAEALNDKSLCAKVSALEFLERTKDLKITSHPNFFYRCCSLFGVELGKSEIIYTKFYEADTQDLLGVGRKLAGASNNSVALYSYSGDKSSYGFKDPNKKYPTEDEVCEPSLSKLTRGDIKNSVVSLKEQKRVLGVCLPMNMGSWDQPHSSFAAKYPFNKVDESESGHVIEVDDTPNHERLHWYHRSGTFTEVDPSGVKVNRIIGDNYTIVDRNGFISIDGDADVTVAGNVNVYCRSHANIQVEGTANLEVGRNLDIGVAKDVNIRTEGNFNVWANGDFNLQAKNNGHILASNNLYQAADKNMYLLSGYVTKDSDGNDVKNAGNLFVESYGNSDYRSLGNTKLYTVGNLSDKVDGSRYNEVKGLINNLWLSDVVTQISGKWDNGVSGETRLSSGGDTSIKASGNIYEDGSEIRMNEGKSKSPSAPITEDDFANNLPQMLSNESIKALIHGMIPPPLGTPLDVRITPIVIASPGAVDGTFETEDETGSKFYTKYSESVWRDDGYSEADSVEIKNVQVFAGEGEKIEPVKGENFQKDEKLSDHFNLSDLTTGAYYSHAIPVGGQKNLTEEQIFTNLKALSVNVLENVLQFLPNGIKGKGKNWIITSGFRTDSSSKKGSQHTLGQAVDIQIIEKGKNTQSTIDTMKNICAKVPYDQAILEYSDSSGNCWIHISYNNDGNRSSKDRTKTMTMNSKFKMEGTEVASNGTVIHQSGSAYKSGLYLC